MIPPDGGTVKRERLGAFRFLGNESGSLSGLPVTEDYPMNNGELVGEMVQRLSAGMRHLRGDPGGCVTIGVCSSGAGAIG
jgi:hypothetical protein